MKGSLVRPLIACGVSVVFALMPVIVTLIAGAIATPTVAGSTKDHLIPASCMVATSATRCTRCGSCSGSAC
jgi:hypothetical protein